MKIKLQKLHPLAAIPQRATPGAACHDLRALILDEWDEETASVEIQPGEALHLRTGLAFEIPQGWAMMIYSRSGHGFKYRTRLVNAVGVIDSDYRGEVKVGLVNDGPAPWVIKHGDAIAQFMLVQDSGPVVFEEVRQLSETERGAGGFGSTDGKAVTK